MKKITDFVVKYRYIFLVIFIILSMVCLYLSNKVNINSDISKYLPETSETKIGKDIMDSEFDEIKSSNLNVMFKGLSDSEKKETLNKLQNIEGVSSVDYDESSEYNNGEYTLYVLNVDDYDHSQTATNVYNEVEDNFNFKAMSGSIYDENKPVLEIWIIVVAIAIAMVILTILSESYIEPWLYLISIGIAVFINKGTNIMFSSVSNITDSITAILQLALSMDYSIMLSNRYRQERENEKNKVKAMEKALYDSFKAISSSSVTTVVGLLALVFMSFTIGKDLGIVLAKGVLLSLVSIFFCLPGLLVLFDKYIIYSKKKSLNLDLTKIAKYSYKTRIAQALLALGVFIVAFFLKDGLGILYTGSQEDEVGKVFPATNQIAIVYQNKYDQIITDYCKSIEDDEKANQVLCYGNTINEKLKYNEVNSKLEDLGQDTSIDEYLLKIIYYNYYNKNTNDSMTLNEFIKFIKSDVYSNDKIDIDSDMKDNINKLEYFSTSNSVNKVRSLKEISNILGLSEDDLKDIMILYNAKNTDMKLTIKEFVDFMINDVSKDSEYKDSISSDTLNSLKKIKVFTDKNTINKKMNSSEISSTFGIDEELVNKLFTFYKTTSNVTSTMTINEFSTYALSLKDDDTFKSMFTSETINKLNILKTLSDEEKINTELSASNLSSILTSLGIKDLDSSTINMLYFYNYYLNNQDTNTKLSLNEFTTKVLSDDNISSLIPNSIKEYKSILTKFSDKDFITTKLDKTQMTSSLTPYGFNETQITAIYSNVYKTYNPTATEEEILNNNLTLSPYELITIIKSNLSQDDSSYTKVSLLLNIMDLSYNSTYNVVPTYTYSELTRYLSSMDSNISEDTIKEGYIYYDYKNSDNKTMSIKELFTFIINNKDNELISSNLGDNLDLLNESMLIMNNIDTRYTYKEMASLTSQSESIIKSIYALADQNGLTISLTPLEFVNLILDNKDNILLKDNLTTESINNLTLIKKVMTSTLNNTKYNASDLSKLFNSDKDTISLVMSLYYSKNIKSSQNISLLNITNFMIKEVINNDKYNSNITEKQKTELKTVNSIMKNTNKNVKYNSLDLYKILSNLSDDIDYDLIDIVYIYHGSKNNYNDSWQLTVEEIINYVNGDLLNDSKYSDFIDDEMRDKIVSAKESIDDAKNMLVTTDYSRAIINSKYPLEGEETFNFVQNTIDTVGSNDGVYVIGDSPMALDISKSFNSELNLITILTMVFIFVVVAVTFKDILIPLVLVLIIQCAVFVTMSILSATGSDVYFIALLIVQAILMGATIDYAIVYTSYYKESRQTMEIQESMINAYNKSIHTIISSSSILIIVTIIVSLFAEAIPSEICKTISQGTICSTVLIIFVLPGVLASIDKIIIKRQNKKLNKSK